MLNPSHNLCQLLGRKLTLTQPRPGEMHSQVLGLAFFFPDVACTRLGNSQGLKSLGRPMCDKMVILLFHFKKCGSEKKNKLLWASEQD